MKVRVLVTDVVMDFAGKVERGLDELKGVKFELDFKQELISALLGVMYCPVAECTCDNDSRWSGFFDAPLGRMKLEVVECCSSSGSPAVLVRVIECGGCVEMRGKLMRFNLRALIHGFTT